MKYMFCLILILSCSSPSINKYSEENPKLVLKDFFSGKLKALGIVQNRSGEVIKRFEAKILASWNGQIATLKEDFIYSDKSTGHRTWTLTHLGKQKYIGNAHDVIGDAHGEVRGNAFYFEYTLSLDVDGTQYNIPIKDWMFLLDENTLMARSYMSKFGFNVGEITLVMLKQGDGK